jgi:hypothetical protein
LGKLTYRKQLLTHQEIHLAFILMDSVKKITELPAGYGWYSINQLSGLAFPKTVANYFRDAQISG